MPVIKALQRAGIPVYGSELNDKAKSYRSIQPSAQFGLVVGNEGNGMDPVLLKQTDTNLYIPIRGQAEAVILWVCSSNHKRSRCLEQKTRLAIGC